MIGRQKSGHTQVDQTLEDRFVDVGGGGIAQLFNFSSFHFTDSSKGPNRLEGADITFQYVNVYFLNVSKSMIVTLFLRRWCVLSCVF